jgi:hypothetical protein
LETDFVELIKDRKFEPTGDFDFTKLCSANGDSIIKLVTEQDHSSDLAKFDMHVLKKDTDYLNLFKILNKAHKKKQLDEKGPYLILRKDDEDDDFVDTVQVNVVSMNHEKLKHYLSSFKTDNDREEALRVLRTSFEFYRDEFTPTIIAKVPSTRTSSSESS